MIRHDNNIRYGSFESVLTFLILYVGLVFCINVNHSDNRPIIYSAADHISVSVPDEGAYSEAEPVIKPVILNIPHFNFLSDLYLQFSGNNKCILKEKGLPCLPRNIDLTPYFIRHFYLYFSNSDDVPLIG